jgi:hypothetical protein
VQPPAAGQAIARVSRDTLAGACHSALASAVPWMAHAGPACPAVLGPGVEAAAVRRAPAGPGTHHGPAAVDPQHVHHQPRAQLMGDEHACQGGGKAVGFLLIEQRRKTHRGRGHTCWVAVPSPARPAPCHCAQGCAFRPPAPPRPRTWPLVWLGLTAGHLEHAQRMGRGHRCHVVAVAVQNRGAASDLVKREGLLHGACGQLGTDLLPCPV